MLLSKYVYERCIKIDIHVHAWIIHYPKALIKYSPSVHVYFKILALTGSIQLCLNHVTTMHMNMTVMYVHACVFFR